MIKIHERHFSYFLLKSCIEVTICHDIMNKNLVPADHVVAVEHQTG